MQVKVQGHLFHFPVNDVRLGTCIVEILGDDRELQKAKTMDFGRVKDPQPNMAKPVNLKTHPHLKYTVRSVAPLLVTVMIFGVILIGGCHFISVRETTTVEELARFYLLLVNGVRTRSYEMNTRYALRYLILTGSIDDAALSDFPEATSFSDYLQNTTAYLGVMDPLNRLLMRPNQSAYGYYAPLFGKTLPLTSSTNFDFLSFLSLTKSFYHEVENWETDSFRQDYSFISNINKALITKVAQTLTRTMYIPTSSNIMAGVTKSQLDSDVIFVPATVVVACLAVLVLGLVRMFRQKIKSIEILTALNTKSLEERLHSLRGRLLMLTGLFSEYPTEEQSTGKHPHQNSHLRGGRCHLSNCSGGSQLELKAVVGGSNPSFVKQEHAVLLVLLLILVPVGLTITARVIYNQENLASVSLFYSYVASIAETRICLATLFDMLVSALAARETSGSIPTAYYGNIWTAYLTMQKNIIAHRSIDDVQTTITQLLRRELAWKETQSILYSSLCSEQDFTCSRLLGRALKAGVQASVVAFAATTVETLSSIAGGNPTQRPAIMRTVGQLMLAYENYVRPQLLNIQLLSLNFMQSSLQRSLLKLTAMLWQVCLPLFVVLFGWLVVITMRREAAAKRLLKECVRYTKRLIQTRKITELQTRETDRAGKVLPRLIFNPRSGTTNDLFINCDTPTEMVSLIIQGFRFACRYLA